MPRSLACGTARGSSWEKQMDFWPGADGVRAALPLRTIASAGPWTLGVDRK